MIDQQHRRSPTAMKRSGIAVLFDAVVRDGIQVLISRTLFSFLYKTGLSN